LPGVDLGAPAQHQLTHGRAVRGADQDPTGRGLRGIGEPVGGTPGRGASAGPSAPSSRTTACTWTAARFWYSATRAKDNRACWAKRDCTMPAEEARRRRTSVTKRSHNLEACACQSTWPM
jgi:hypothetical protein